MTFSLQPAHIPRALGADGTWSLPDGSKLKDEQFASFKIGRASCRERV